MYRGPCLVARSQAVVALNGLICRGRYCQVSIRKLMNLIIEWILTVETKKFSVQRNKSLLTRFRFAKTKTSLVCKQILSRPPKIARSSVQALYHCLFVHSSFLRVDEWHETDDANLIELDLVSPRQVLYCMPAIETSCPKVCKWKCALL
jgi:hypothetical protein